MLTTPMKPSLAQLEAEALAIPHALNLPPCPQVLLEVGRELRCEAPDVQKVARLIMHDATSAAMILKTVNSPYYGLSNKARSVQQAIAHLGLNRTSCLLAGLLLRNAFPSTAKGAMARFWEVSTETALTAAVVARSTGTIDRGEAHTFGLFRDVGSAVLICRFDAYATLAELDGNGRAAELTALERARFGADHATIGARLASGWQLPAEMCEAILRHHSDFATGAAQPVSSAALRLIALGWLCDRIIDDYHKVEANADSAHLDMAALSVLKLTDDAFAAVADEAMGTLEEAAAPARRQAASARY